MVKSKTDEEQGKEKQAEKTQEEVVESRIDDMNDREREKTKNKDETEDDKYGVTQDDIDEVMNAYDYEDKTKDKSKGDANKKADEVEKVVEEDEMNAESRRKEREATIKVEQDKEKADENEEEEEIEVFADQSVAKVEDDDGRQEEGETDEKDDKDSKKEVVEEDVNWQLNVMKEMLKDKHPGIEDKTPEKIEEKKPEPKPEPKVEPVRQEVKYDPLEFITEEEFSSAVDSREGMNEVLNKVYEANKQEFLRAVPQIIQSIIPEYIELNNATNDFFKRNTALTAKDHGSIIAHLGNKVRAENPDMGIAELFEQIEKEVSKIGGRLKKADSGTETVRDVSDVVSDKVTEKKKSRPTNLRKTNKRIIAPTKLTGEEAEVAETYNLN